VCMNAGKLIYHQMCEDLRLSSRAAAHSLGAKKFSLKQSGNLKNAKNNFGTTYEDVVNIKLRESNLFELDGSKINFRFFDMWLCALLE
jgi:hypothetical protein